jgi:nephrocystin-3
MAAENQGEGGDDRRLIRIFVSSTFHDFQEERDLLVRQVFPEIRHLARERAVEVVEVDLRWGVTAEQSERGETLAVCLDEIDRCRPYFIGLLGERYGWVPPPEVMEAGPNARFAWLASATGASATELEIVHGVLNRPDMVDRAFFYFRDPAWARARSAAGEAGFASEGGEADEKLRRLKARIRLAAAHLVDGYPEPHALAGLVRADLVRVLDETYPAAGPSDWLDRARRQHASYAQDRQGVYVGGSDLLGKLDAWVAAPKAPPVLVVGRSGSGKSALLANWTAAHRARFRADFVFEHYLASTADSADPLVLLRRLAAAVQAFVGDAQSIAVDISRPAETFAACLAAADLAAQASRSRLVIVLDGLDRLTDMADLRWLPNAAPATVKLVASSIGGDGEESSYEFRHGDTESQRQALAEGKLDETLFPGALGSTVATDAWRRRGWEELDVPPLSVPERRRLVELILERRRKALSADQLDRIVAHPDAGLPLFLKTLVDELRVFGQYEALDARLNDYLACPTTEALFDALLQRLEVDCGATLVRDAMTLIWAGRAGLEETELLEALDAPPAVWAPLGVESADVLTDAMGGITFGHDFMRRAVARRYVTDEAAAAAHLRIADLFAPRLPAPRAAEETPWQLRAVRAWERLERLVTDLYWFAAAIDRGDAEMFSYWLPLKARGAVPGEALAAAWGKRFPDDRNVPLADLGLGRRLADFLAFSGARDEASLQFCEWLVDAHRGTLRAGDLQTAAAIRILARAVAARGDYRAAENLQRGLLDELVRNAGERDVETMQTTVDLAAILNRRRHWLRAIELLSPMLDAAGQTLGADAAITLAGNAELAQALGEVGRYEEAEALRKAGYDARARTLGRIHPATMDALEDLISTIVDRGELHVARAEAGRLLEVRRATLGADHPDTLRALRGLALVSNKLMDREADATLEQAVSEYERVLGRLHPETLEVKQELVDIRYPHEEESDRLVKLEAMLREVLGGRQEVLGAEASEVLDTLKSLAQVQLRLRKAHDAEATQQRLAEVCLKLYGADSALTASAEAELGFMRRALNEPGLISERENQPQRWMPALGIAFDIDRLEKPFYGADAYRLLFDALEPDLLRNTRWRDGDTNATLDGDDRTYVISIEALDAGQLSRIQQAVAQLQHPALQAGEWRFLSGEQLAAEPLVVTMRIGPRGVPDWSDGPSFPLQAWAEANRRREEMAHH